MLRKAFLLFLILGACSQQKAVEVQEDIPVQDTIVEPPAPVVVESIPVPADTIFNQITVDQLLAEGNPATPQIDPNVAYVFKKGGIDVYEVNREFKIEKVVGHFDYKSKIQLLSPIKKETPLTIDGMKGYYALIQYENRMAYVFTGWLMNLPVPEEPSIFGFFFTALHIERAQQSSNLRRYEFEQGMLLDFRTDTDDASIVIPGMTIQQAWLLANYFVPGIDTFMKQMPADSAMIRVHQDVYYQVEMKDGKVYRITHKDDSGCPNFTSFTDTGDGIKIYWYIGC